MKRPYIGACVCWVYAPPHRDSLIGRPTAARVVNIHDAERGTVDLQADKRDCHGSILVKDVQYSDDGEPGTWHWPGE